MNTAPADLLAFAAPTAPVTGARQARRLRVSPVALEIGLFLRMRRERRKLMQRDLAPKMGRGKASLGLIERGERLLTLPTFVRLAGALDLCLGELDVVLTEAAEAEPKDLAKAMARALGPLLRERRESRGLSVHHVARKIAREPGAFLRFERGDRCPTLVDLLRWAGVLQIHLGDFEYLRIQVALIDDGAPVRARQR